jgi:hypothetical protein
MVWHCELGNTVNRSQNPVLLFVNAVSRLACPLRSNEVHEYPKLFSTTEKGIARLLMSFVHTVEMISICELDDDARKWMNMR